MHGCATEAKALNVPKLCMHMHMHMHMHHVHVHVHVHVCYMFTCPYACA
jgi:hypothetical protein